MNRGHYTRFRGRGTHLVGLRAHADVGCPSAPTTNIAQLPLILLGCRILQCYGALRLPESSDGGKQGEERERGEENEKGARIRGFRPMWRGLSAKIKQRCEDGPDGRVCLRAVSKRVANEDMCTSSAGEATEASNAVVPPIWSDF